MPLLRTTSRKPELLKGALSGLVGGLVATWVMTQFQTRIPAGVFEQLLGGLEGDDEPENEEPAEAESDDGGDDMPATEKAAERVATAVLGYEFESDEERTAAGQAVHYTFGTCAGIAYGAVAEGSPALSRAMGAPFGAAFWMLADEIGVPLAGLAEPPWKHPASTHLYSLASHIVYGVTLETVRRTLRGLL